MSEFSKAPPHDPEKLARWVWDALLNEPLEQINPTGRVSVPMQLQQLAFTDLAFARRLKDALAIAIVEWQAAHGLPLLASLARCAAYVRASGVVPVLHSVLTSGRIDGWLANDAHDDDVSVVIGVIAAFAPHATARTALDNLFVDRRYRARFPSQLVTGLVKADVDNYPVYVEQLLQMCEDDGLQLDMLGVTREIVRIATPATIVRELPRFTEQWHYGFCELLGGYPLSPGRWSSQQAFVLQIAAAKKFAPVEYDPEDPAQASDVCDVIDKRISLDGGIGSLMSLIEKVSS